MHQQEHAKLARHTCIVVIFKSRYNKRNLEGYNKRNLETFSMLLGIEGECLSMFFFLFFRELDFPQNM